VNTFKKAGDKLTYFEMAQLIKRMIGEINQVEEWEYEDLMYWLDGCNLANIEFNDINIWLKEFDVDFGIQIKAYDQEDEFQAS